MRINENFILKTVAGSPTVIAVGEAANTFKKMITLNASAECVWRSVEKGSDLDGVVKSVMEKYGVCDDDAADIERIRTDVVGLLEQMRALGILED